jgi:multiple antibiotic resistance protein
MVPETSNPILMFMALLALYSPLAALSSYLPIVGRFGPGDQLRLATGLFVNVTAFVLLAVWVGEPILKLLGVTTAALSVTGGIALLYAGIPMMRGLEQTAPASDEKSDAIGENATQESWRSVMFMPLTFPLTIGGTSFGLIVAFAASAQGPLEGIYLSIAGLAYAALTGLTLYAAGHLHRRVSGAAMAVLSRVAGYYSDSDRGYAACQRHHPYGRRHFGTPAQSLRVVDMAGGGGRSRPLSGSIAVAPRPDRAALHRDGILY